jgi:hypothetical protein
VYSMTNTVQHSTVQFSTKEPLVYIRIIDCTFYTVSNDRTVNGDSGGIWKETAIFILRCYLCIRLGGLRTTMTERQGSLFLSSRL